MGMKKLDHFPVGTRCFYYRWVLPGRWATGVIERNDGQTVDVRLEDGTLMTHRPAKDIEKWQETK